MKANTREMWQNDLDGIVASCGELTKGAVVWMTLVGQGLWRLAVMQGQV